MYVPQLTSNDVWAVCQTYGVEAARASIVAEIINVFGAYGIAVDPRHLGLVADHMTFDGGYRPLNRAGMADFSSPCLQVRAGGDLLDPVVAPPKLSTRFVASVGNSRVVSSLKTKPCLYGVRMYDGGEC